MTNKRITKWVASGLASLALLGASVGIVSQLHPPDTQHGHRVVLIAPVATTTLAPRATSTRVVFVRSTPTPGSTPTTVPTDTPTPLPTATPAPSWHTIKTFSGNTAGLVGTVSPTGLWRVLYACGAPPPPPAISTYWTLEVTMPVPWVPPPGEVSSAQVGCYAPGVSGILEAFADVPYPIPAGTYTLSIPTSLPCGGWTLTIQEWY